MLLIAFISLILDILKVQKSKVEYYYILYLEIVENESIDWKSCVRQKRTESSNLSCCARKSTTQQGGAFLFESEIRTGCERSEKTPRRGVCPPLCVSQRGSAASESLLLRQKKHHPTGWWLFFLIGNLLYSPSAAPAASTALRTHSVQGHRTLPVSTPFKSLQIVAPHLSRKPRRISRA